MPELKTGKKRHRRSKKQIEQDRENKRIALLSHEATKEEVYDHLRIRKEARDRVPGALDVLDKIMHFDAFELRVRTEEREKILALCKGRGYDSLIRDINGLGQPELSANKSNPTITQMLDAAKLIFERAGDRPGIAPPSDENVTEDYLVLDSSVMPKPQ